MGLDYKTITAAGSWDGSVGAGATAFGQRGGAFSYGGVGDYDFTMDGQRALDISDCAVISNMLGLADRTLRAVHTSDTVKQFLVETLAGVAGEGDINMATFKISSLEQNLRMQIVAAGSFQGSVGAGATAFGQRGGVVARTGAGVYTVTLDGNNAVDSTEGIVLASIKGATRGTISVVHTSDTVKTITIRDGAGAPAAADLDFDWAVIRFAP